MAVARRGPFVAQMAIVGAILASGPFALAWYDYDSGTVVWRQSAVEHPILSSCDDCLAMLELPFPFPFYGTTYRFVKVSSNGFVWFTKDAAGGRGAEVLGQRELANNEITGDAALHLAERLLATVDPKIFNDLQPFAKWRGGDKPNCNSLLAQDHQGQPSLAANADPVLLNQCVSLWWNALLRYYAAPDNRAFSFAGQASIPSPLIAPWWDDWDPRRNGRVTYGETMVLAPTQPSAVGVLQPPFKAQALFLKPGFTISWENVAHHSLPPSSSATYSFQLTLFPTGSFEFQYRHARAGVAAIDGARSGSVGYQEAYNTVGHPLGFNTDFLQDNLALRFRPPGALVLYSLSFDGYMHQPRPGIHQRVSYTCNNQTVTREGVSDVNGTLRFSEVTCSNPQHSLSHYIDATDDAGYEVRTIPERGLEVNLRKGAYRFIRRSDMTPQPTRRTSYSVAYGDSTSHTSTLDWWQSGPWDKPILIVPGINVLNNVSTADYYVLLGSLLRTLQREGYDVAIGKWGDGNQRVSWYSIEAGTWIRAVYDASTAMDKRIQVAGVSMGGVVVRDALQWAVPATQMVKAWYSLDAPQKGANMGGGYRGVQALLMCYREGSDDYKTAFSNPSWDLVYESSTTCHHCEGAPEDISCDSTSAAHDAFYQGLGAWPPASIPSFAVANGDATGYFSPPVGSQAYVLAELPFLGTIVAPGYLYYFYYSAESCSANREWFGVLRDCLSGSKLLTNAQVHSSKDVDWCETFTLDLLWEPSFINVDSALASAVSGYAGDSAGCTSRYVGFVPGPWTDWVANDYNEFHHIVSEKVEASVLAWIRSQ